MSKGKSKGFFGVSQLRARAVGQKENARLRLKLICRLGPYVYDNFPSALDIMCSELMPIGVIVCARVDSPDTRISG